MNNDVPDINPRPAEIIPGETTIEKINQGKLKITMETKQMYGIEETKDVVVFLCKTTNAVLDSLKDDGKITIGDFPKFGGVAMALFPAFSGINEVPKELAELSEDEVTELIALVKDELELDGNVEEVIAKALTIASEIKDLIDLVKQLKNGAD
ncbi:MAG: hypothetical protein B6D44_15210 [Ignavibacteriales bacterium UTCHB2]|jgi:hypothetical protein|nr:MAG: hypothetical protein B6D44_15210 [Ignavibacteriales bacterium UTCHB2]